MTTVRKSSKEQHNPPASKPNIVFDEKSSRSSLESQLIEKEKSQEPQFEEVFYVLNNTMSSIKQVDFSLLNPPETKEQFFDFASHLITDNRWNGFAILLKNLPINITLEERILLRFWVAEDIFRETAKHGHLQGQYYGNNIQHLISFITLRNEHIKANKKMKLESLAQQISLELDWFADEYRTKLNMDDYIPEGLRKEFLIEEKQHPVAEEFKQSNKYRIRDAVKKRTENIARAMSCIESEVNRIISDRIKVEGNKKKEMYEINWLPKTPEDKFWSYTEETVILDPASKKFNNGNIFFDSRKWRYIQIEEYKPIYMTDPETGEKRPKALVLEDNRIKTLKSYVTSLKIFHALSKNVIDNLENYLINHLLLSQIRTSLDFANKKLIQANIISQEELMQVVISEPPHHLSTTSSVISQLKQSCLEHSSSSTKPKLVDPIDNENFQTLSAITRSKSKSALADLKDQWKFVSSDLQGPASEKDEIDFSRPILSPSG